MGTPKYIVVRRQSKAKEARLWITQVIGPGILAAGIMSTTPLGQKIGDSVRKGTKKLKKFFTKKDS